jgi:hypothetical protein
MMKLLASAGSLEEIEAAVQKYFCSSAYHVTEHCGHDEWIISKNYQRTDKPYRVISKRTRGYLRFRFEYTGN